MPDFEVPEEAVEAAAAFVKHLDDLLDQMPDDLPEGYTDGFIRATEEAEVNLRYYVARALAAAVPALTAHLVERANREWVGLKPDGWGSNPADQQTIDFAKNALDWLRAALSDPAPTTEGDGRV